MKVKIYALIDPQTNEVRYIGKTIQTLKKRLTQHLCDGNNTYKTNWIKKLKTNGLKPKIELIELVDDSEWVIREQYWISKYNNLTNLTDGGESGAYFTDEILSKISKGVKNVWKNDEYRNNKIAKIKEYWSDPENRKKASERMKSRVFDYDRTNIINMKKEQWKDDEYREKMSRQSKELWQDDEYKEKVLGYLQSDEHREIVSERFKGRKISNETKIKMSKSNKNKKVVVIDGVEYESITQASKILNINRDALKGRLKSKNFTNYNYK